MGVSVVQMAVTVAILGAISFVLGILAEIKKPESGKPSIENGEVKCNYPTDPSVYLGFASIATLTASCLLGFYSVFYPYNSKSIPFKALFHTSTMVVFFQIALWVSILGEGMLMWATITEVNHLKRREHHNMNTKCSTAKTGLFGGAAFMSLNASLFWLLSLMLANNARDDFFGLDVDEVESLKGHYSQVHHPDSNGQPQPPPPPQHDAKA